MISASSRMDRDVSVTGTGRRPTVIQWVGKNFPSEMNLKTNDCDTSTFNAYAMSTQEHGHSDRSNESSEDQQAKNDDEPLPVTSNNTKGKYDCLICKKSFKCRSVWKSHERIHTGERPFPCEICGKAFTRSDGLQSHKKVHLKIKKPCPAANQPHYILEDNTVRDKNNMKQKVFICPHCGRTFYSLAGYYKHANTKHKGKKDIRCEICKARFDRPSALDVHSRVHTGRKPYRCGLCSKAFAIHGNLKRHSFIHSGERPYACTHCSSCFNNSSHLARHIKAKHKRQ